MLDSLTDLEVLTIRDEPNVGDLDVLSRLTSIAAIVLANLKQVENIPSLKACARLRRMQLERLRIRELRGVAEASRLEEFAVSVR